MKITSQQLKETELDPLELKADVLNFVEGWFEHEATAEY
tara:strand:- start:588 stop:704 length:117 start_codon:yes stop_codon:yes gene_type:complete